MMHGGPADAVRLKAWAYLADPSYGRYSGFGDRATRMTITHLCRGGGIRLRSIVWPSSVVRECGDLGIELGGAHRWSGADL